MRQRFDRNAFPNRHDATTLKSLTLRPGILAGDFEFTGARLGEPARFPGSELLVVRE